MKLRTKKLAVFVTCLGVAAAFPVMSSADRGGKPHSNNGNNHGKACPGKGKGKGPKKSLSDLPSQARDKGKKCGFHKQENGQQQTTTAPTGSTSTETETNTTTSTTVSTV